MTGDIKALTQAIRDLGNGNASTHFGAIEALGMVHKEGLQAIADALRQGLSDVAESQQQIASALGNIDSTLCTFTDSMAEDLNRLSEITDGIKRRLDASSI